MRAVATDYPECGRGVGEARCNRPLTHSGEHKPTSERTIDEWHRDECEVSMQRARAEHGAPLWTVPSF